MTTRGELACERCAHRLAKRGEPSRHKAHGAERAQRSLATKQVDREPAPGTGARARAPPSEAARGQPAASRCASAGSMRERSPLRVSPAVSSGCSAERTRPGRRRLASTCTRQPAESPSRGDGVPGSVARGLNRPPASFASGQAVGRGAPKPAAIAACCCQRALPVLQPARNSGVTTPPQPQTRSAPTSEHCLGRAALGPRRPARPAGALRGAWAGAGARLLRRAPLGPAAARAAQLAHEVAQLRQVLQAPAQLRHLGPARVAPQRAAQVVAVRARHQACAVGAIMLHPSKNPIRRQ